ncbi:MAG TPA: DUF934 domain-containing protein [Rhizomicrobium sp.]|nr:DUF934 domain-containing protein [Rhizomicrobium sp.]
MPLIKDGKFVADRFVFVPEGAAFPEDGGVMVTLDRFQSERNALIAHHRPVAVRLASNENPEVLKSDLHNIAAIALEFPIFRDGRAFSWARMLRTRFGYTGEIRAVGHFLYDQLAFMVRVGFDAFDVRQDFTIEDFERAMKEMTYVYQPSADGVKTIRELRAGR